MNCINQTLRNNYRRKIKNNFEMTRFEGEKKKKSIQKCSFYWFDLVKEFWEKKNQSSKIIRRYICYSKPILELELEGEMKRL